MKIKLWLKVGLIFFLSVTLILQISFTVIANEVKYIYDDLGRLYQVVDEQGNVATYNYDAVGNLLSITRSTGGLQAPEITGISPNLANPGDNVQVTISGDHFLNTGVSTGNAGIIISNLQITETSITATFSVSFFAPVGLTMVTVNNALGSARIGFTVNPQPIINALSPPYGPVSRFVTISGTGFSAVPSENLVRFSGVPAPIYSCTPFNILTSVPAGATSGAVTVTTKGMVSNWKVFTVISGGPPPAIDSVIPDVGSVEGGSNATINGSGFTSDTKVFIGQKPVASVTVIDASTLRTVSAPGVVGTWDVLVTNQNGDALLPGGFTYLLGPPMKIASVNPGMGQTNIPINILITGLFTRPVDRATVSASTFSLAETDTAIPVSGTFSFNFDDKIVIFKPTAALKPTTSYTLNITIGVKSSDGIPLDQPFNSSFTTTGFSDSVSPVVTMSPENGATGVPINALIVFMFSEPVNPVTINSSTIIVTNNGMPISGNITFSYQNTVVTFAPLFNFLPSSFINIALSSRVADVAGNPIVGNGGVGTYFVNSFTTADTFDTTAPSVVAVNPPDKATGIDTDTTVSVTFSEPVNRATVNTTTFTVSVGGTRYSGQISFSEHNTKTIFTPDQPLPYLSLVTVSLAAGINDVAGNAMTTSFTSTFTTEPESILTLAYPGPTTLSIGDTINVDVSNTGDKDTALIYKVSLSGRGAVLYQTTLTDAIQAGATKSYGFQVPNHVAEGNYDLYAEVTNNKGKKTTGFFFVKILGLNATLTTRTDKDFYLATEPIIAITTIQNGSFGIEGGGLKIAVSRMGSSATGQFSQFLPKGAWAVFKDPIGVATVPDGSFYVADAGNYRVQKFDSTGKFNKMWGKLGHGYGEFEKIWTIAVGPDASVYVGDTYDWILRIQRFDKDGNFISQWGWDGGGSLDHSFGIAVGPDGSVYGTDQFHHRILKFSNNGRFLLQWGGYGSGNGQFSFPTGIAVGQDGSVYVADTENNRIQKFDSGGNFIAKWGSYGEGDGQLNGPFSIAVGPDSSIYVVDGKSYLGEHRIQKFDSNGNFIAKWLDYGSGEGSSNIAVAPGGSVYVTDTYNNRIRRFDSNGNLIAQWGNYGDAEEQFNSPSGIALGPDGSVYVADTYNHRIQKFDSNANFVFKWGGEGSGDGRFYYPQGIAIGPDGSVFVADSGNARIQKFDRDGNFIAKWGDYGSGDGQFAGARGIAVGLDGLVYVADTVNNRIQVFDSNGNFVKKWGVKGSGEGQFSSPGAIAIGFDGYIHVTDTANNRIQVFDSSGNFIRKWGTPGSGDGQFISPNGIAAGPDGSFFVVDSNNHRIQMFDSDGVFITKWGRKGYENGQFMWPYGIGLGPDGSVYVTDAGNCRIQKLIAEILFETTIPINQPGNTSQDYTTNIETLSAAGSLYLQATLLNSLGQIISQDSYPFFRGEPLSVVSVIPTMGLNNVPINTLITVQFSKPVDLITVSGTSFSLVESVSGTSVSGTFLFDFGDRLVILRPNNNLIPNTTYTLSITKEIKSAEGIPLDQPFSGSFTTAGLADTVSPTVFVIPQDGATEVPVNALIVFSFSEPMNPLLINSSTVAVTNNGMPVSGNIMLSQQNTVATFTLGSSFLPNSVVNITLSRRVTDMAGNPIVGNGGPGTDFISSFSTASAADSVPPQILSFNPPNGATGIDISTAVSITFSEPVNPITVNNATFIVSVAGTPSPGRISFSGQNTVATFTPDQPFPTNSLVTVALSAGISDVAGNAISPFTSTFTTYQQGPVLTIAYSGALTRTVGETVNVEVANTGDADTTSTYMVKLSDANGLVIYQNTIIEVIQAGASKNYSFQVPNQAADGDYLLYAEATDSKSKKTSASFDFRIIGLNATLNTRTDKDIYLPTEAVTGITSIVNGPFGIENGSLKVSVSGIASTAAGGFKHFLPKEVGAIFNYPWGIAVGPDGSIYVVDTDNHCVQKFDSNGNFITKWGSFGWSDGQFYYPNSIAAGSDGFVYVADTENHRIQKFDSSGTFITTWGAEGTANEQFYQPSGIAISFDGYVYVADTGNDRVQKLNSNGNFISKWGGYGRSDGQFNSPYGVGVGPDGSVYVADTYNDRIQKFDANGQFITKWGSSGSGDGQFYWACGIAVGTDGSVYVADAGSDRIQKFSSSGTLITKWGSYGEGNGQFNGPSGIAIGGDNSVYVTDSGNNRVEKFGNNGTFIAKWGSGGERDGAFAEPSGIAIGPDGSIYVTDTYNDRVQKFDATGNFLLKWGTYGYGYGEFSTPSSIAVGSDGSVYVADRSNNLIQKFDSNGNFILAWEAYSVEYLYSSSKSVAVGPDGLIYVLVEPSIYPYGDYEIQKFDSYGYFLTRWMVSPYSEGIAIGSEGFVYVVAPVWNLIQKFDMDGNYIMGWGSYGTGNGEFNSPQGISVGPDGFIYVVDTGNHRIQKFDSNGNFIAKWGSYGWQDGQFDQPLGIVVGSDGSVYVADTRNHRIQKMIGGDTTQTLFQATLSINQSASTNQDYSTNIGALGVTAKFYLQTTLTNSLGQTLGQSSYPFYLFTGGTALFFSTDKKVYKSGEIVTITGRVENRGTTDAANLVLTFQSKLVGQSSQSLYTDTFDLPAGGSHPFMSTTSAGAVGTVILTGTVGQNNSILVEIKDQYQVVNP